MKLSQATAGLTDYRCFITLMRQPLSWRWLLVGEVVSYKTTAVWQWFYQADSLSSGFTLPSYRFVRDLRTALERAVPDRVRCARSAAHLREMKAPDRARVRCQSVTVTADTYLQSVDCLRNSAVCEGSVTFLANHNCLPRRSTDTRFYTRARRPVM